MKNISILGSTGSIGTQTLDIAEVNKEFNIVALCANKNVSLIEKQIRQFKPKYAAMMDEKAAEELKIKVADLPVKVMSGIEGVCACATADEVDTVVTAVVGVIGLVPTIEAVKAGKTIALANKETLVAGGSIVMPLAKEKGVKILPVDSEHSAIFQCIANSHVKPSKILLTASGGAFFGKSKEEIENAKAEDALKHPNWDMGAKVTIDSASLMNKGLEVIEATWLFDMPADDIEVIVQRQSIIHSMVEFEDNSVIAQLSVPDMRLPISYALTYPERKYCKTEKIDFFKLANLTFDKPDTDTFRCLKLAYNAAKAGGSMPAVMNAANEEAVRLFLKGRIKFGDISRMVESEMDAHKVIDNPKLEDILAINREMSAKYLRK
ncbi:MAG: 1-deoxy-D-xylulose-5-phosphate reductoisomerase [Clostridia bacterium]|nr:1-deoxy-D-xylulose-5-phosphate reductoisomerase [Clostridia bacterium]